MQDNANDPLIPLDDLPTKGIRYSRNYIDRMIKEDRFPKPVFLSPRRRAFLESEIDAWLKARVDQRDKVAA
ncbi:helix-turn-helix transcriptional regulator [Mesorhizobium muleiense]|uniref:helix-turn-helix transcriptional regulator n=1 Tax=Mesorhizobium muleiense TaxID=1004279 RepID=UPI001F27734B|nr:AlpA family phage regulatory protein [Mesorhizobium muleiense]MCF6112393.1 AlpA family phage regulatory protein [Mesorhizobium muleiense]